MKTYVIRGARVTSLRTKWFIALLLEIRILSADFVKFQLAVTSLTQGCGSGSDYTKIAKIKEATLVKMQIRRTS